jgi:uncharacterized membrane protein
MEDRTQLEEGIRGEAEARAAQVAAFKNHVKLYLLGNALTVLLWLFIVLVSRGGVAWFPWFLFVMAGWGIALAIKAWSMYGPPEVNPEELILAEVRRIKSDRF